MIPVILCGGSGTRLWPLSRALYPKQFLPLVTDKTMLQETVRRIGGMDSVESPIVVCNADYRFMVAEQLREIGVKAAAILLEPTARNTAPAITLAALAAKPDDVLLVLPADHAIENIESFHSALRLAGEQAELGLLATFGIVPTSPETGYGYIKRSGATGAGEVWAVEQFVEKPDLETARQYVESGRYFWNSGMFMFKAARFLEELDKFNHAMFDACQKAYDGAVSDLDFVRIDGEAFSQCPSDSIDYAVMEKTADSVVVPLDAGWNDIGSWSVLWDVSKKDAQGNAKKGDVMVHDTHYSYVHSESKLVAAVGVENLVIVETEDAVMVAAMDRVQEVKSIVERLLATKRSEACIHHKVYRPWGYYNSIDMGERYQAKLIVVKPGGKLSLQMHHHWAEHWIVVKGTALVTKGQEQILLSENQSTYIPIGTMHRLENPGVIPLEMVEVQSGGYIGEDDIVRFDDQYGRK
ncbi:MAG: mannose-1-phosphate guanylyltransferase/mannose-6-phosphate isomerase [Pseudomonadota bacterium]